MDGFPYSNIKMSVPAQGPMAAAKLLLEIMQAFVNYKHGYSYVSEESAIKIAEELFCSVNLQTSEIEYIKSIISNWREMFYEGGLSAVI